MPTDLPPAFWIAWWGVFGLIVGSFLNVCIHRLPREGQSVWHPRRSHCPKCGHQITWRENLPVLSWVLQRGRCASCAWRIPWRYPLVEALTALLFALAAWRATVGAPDGQGDWALVPVWSLVLAGLVVATFVDFDFFEIPDEVSIGGMVVAPVASLLVPALHAETWVAQRFSEGAEVDRVGALLGCVAGMLVGGGMLLAIGKVGSRLFGRDAMGFGDVKLLAAGGGFVGPGGAAAAMMIGAILASVVGLLNLVRFTCFSRQRARARGATKSFGRSLQSGRIAARYIPFGPYLGIGIGIVLLDWNHVLRLLRLLLQG